MDSDLDNDDWTTWGLPFEGDDDPLRMLIELDRDTPPDETPSSQVPDTPDPQDGPPRKRRRVEPDSQGSEGEQLEPEPPSDDAALLARLSDHDLAELAWAATRYGFGVAPAEGAGDEVAVTVAIRFAYLLLTALRPEMEGTRLDALVLDQALDPRNCWSSAELKASDWSGAVETALASFAAGTPCDTETVRSLFFAAPHRQYADPRLAITDRTSVENSQRRPSFDGTRAQPAQAREPQVLTLTQELCDQITSVAAREFTVGVADLRKRTRGRATKAKHVAAIIMAAIDSGQAQQYTNSQFGWTTTERKLRSGARKWSEDLQADVDTVIGLVAQENNRSPERYRKLIQNFLRTDS